MTNEELIRLTINGVVISWTALAAGSLLAASLYDARQYRLKTFINRNKNSRQLRPRPLISIIVPFQNHQASITDCLESVLKNSYRKYEVLLADAGSSDATHEKSRQFVADNPKKPLKLLDQAGFSSLPKAIRAAGQLAKGDLIMVLDGDSRLEEPALKKAVLQMNLTKVDSVGLNIKVEPNSTVLGLYEQFEYLVRYQARKLNSLLHLGRGFENGVIYRRSALDSGRQIISYRYVAGALIYKRPSGSYASVVRRQKQRPEAKGGLQILVRVYLSAMRVLAPFLFAFFIYQAFYFRQVFLFGLAWASLIVFLSLTVLADEHSSIKRRLRLIALTPMMYAPFFLTSLIAPVVALKNLFLTPIRGLKARLRLPAFLGAAKEEKIA